MSSSDLFEVVRERLAKVDPNNRKVVAVFQVISGDQNWVCDLKDLNVYEGFAENPDATVIADIPTFVQLVKKEITIEQAQKEGKLKIEGNVDLVIKAQAV